NVRELRIVIERAAILGGAGEIELRNLPGALSGQPSMPQEAADDMLRIPVGIRMSDVEEAYIDFTLRHTKNNQRRAAEVLGLCLRTLHNKLSSYQGKKTRAAACEPRQI